MNMSRQYRLLPFQLLNNCAHANKLQVESHEENKSHHPGEIEGASKNSAFKPLNNAHLAHTNQPSRPADQSKQLTLLFGLRRLVWADRARELAHRHRKRTGSAQKPPNLVSKDEEIRSEMDPEAGLVSPKLDMSAGITVSLNKGISSPKPRKLWYWWGWRWQARMYHLKKRIFLLRTEHQRRKMRHKDTNIRHIRKLTNRSQWRKGWRNWLCRQ